MKMNEKKISNFFQPLRIFFFQKLILQFSYSKIFNINILLKKTTNRDEKYCFI